MWIELPFRYTGECLKALTVPCGWKSRRRWERNAHRTCLGGQCEGGGEGSKKGFTCNHLSIIALELLLGEINCNGRDIVF